MATAILNGTLVDDGGFVCEVRFEYGLVPGYGLVTPWRGGYTAGMTFQELVRNLPGGATVYCRAVARNPMGLSYGYQQRFTTIPTIPIVVTDPATQISTTHATLNGTIVQDMGAGCETRFEYGATSAYGMQTPWVSGYVTGDSFADEILGIAPGHSYHFRAVARNRYGVGYGQDVTFSTLSDMGPRTGMTMELALLVLEDGS